MGLYLSEIVVSTAFERAYISGRIYTILCTSCKFCKSYTFWRWDTKEPLLNTIRPKDFYFPKSDSQKQCLLDFSTAVISFLLLMLTGYGCDIFDFVSSIQLFLIWCILWSRFSNCADFVSSVGSKQPTNRASLIIPLV